MVGGDAPGSPGVHSCGWRGSGLWIARAGALVLIVAAGQGGRWHYRVHSWAKEAYRKEHVGPACFCYTSPTTKPHLVANPYFVPDMLQLRGWTRFAYDYGMHFKHTRWPMFNSRSGLGFICLSVRRRARASLHFAASYEGPTSLPMSMDNGTLECESMARC